MPYQPTSKLMKMFLRADSSGDPYLAWLFGYELISG